MPKEFLKKLMPKAHEITNHRILKRLGPIILEPQLWHLHRRNVAKAFSIGVFCAFLPVPIQMLLAAIFAIIWRANLPLSLGLVWISNPLTIPPMLYFSYKVGTWILTVPIEHVKFHLSFEWFAHEIATIWKPLLVGSLVCGLIAAVIANIGIRIVWRLWVVKRYELRKLRRQQRR